jgi:hypothetical protein
MLAEVSIRNFLWAGIICAISGCFAGGKVIHNKQEIPFHSDGKTNDWGNNVNYDERSGFSYKLSSDPGHLYIMLKVSDLIVQRKVIMGGLKVWIDTTNSKKERLGIFFPQEIQLGELQSKDPEDNSPESLKKMLSEMRHQIKFIGINDSHLSRMDTASIETSLSFDSDGALIYECAVPVDFITRNRNWEKAISVGFVIGKLNFPVEKEHMGGGGPDGEMNGGGPPEGGMGENGPPPGEMQKQLLEETKLWVKNYFINAQK